MIYALTLSDKDRGWITVLLIVFLLVILVLAVFGFIGILIEKIMKYQSKKVDTYMAKIVVAKKLTKAEDFASVAKKKSNIIFFEQSIAPICCIVVAFIIYFIYHSVKNGGWDESFFNYNTGLFSLFFVPEWRSIEISISTANFIEFNVNWLNTPHFLSGGYICNYFIAILVLTGTIWYLINVQAYCSRLYRIYRVKRKIYSKDLDHIDLSDIYNLDNIDPNLPPKEKANETVDHN